MNLFSSSYKISGLEPDASWVYAFGGKLLETASGQDSRSKSTAYEKAQKDSVFASRLLNQINIHDCEVFITRQIHGDQIYILDDDSILPSEVRMVEADAIITNLRRKPLAVLTADCVPVVLFDSEQKVIGVVHAGRRGTALHILGQTIRKMKSFYEVKGDNIQVGIGPAIMSCCYEVGGECAQEFLDNPEGWRRWVRAGHGGKVFLDLIAANCEEALKEGVPKENLFVSERCTFCENKWFYSYRRGEIYGRNVSLAMLF